MENKRAHVIVSGRVQGVFFREHTRRAAVRIGVSGWVKNLMDGTVEAVFEGEKEKVESAIKWCRTGSPHSRVDNVEAKWEDYLGEFQGFEVIS